MDQADSDTIDGTPMEVASEEIPQQQQVCYNVIVPTFACTTCALIYLLGLF